MLTALIRLAPFAEVLDLCRPLIERHWDEVALHKDLMQLAPDLERYEFLEQNGKLFTLLAETVHGEPVGYSASIVSNHLHYRDLIVCQNDVLFVSPEHRGLAGRMLIEETELEAIARGAKLMLWHAKKGSRFDRILSRSDQYTVQDIIYSRRL